MFKVIATINYFKFDLTTCFFIPLEINKKFLLHDVQT